MKFEYTVFSTHEDIYGGYGLLLPGVMRVFAVVDELCVLVARTCSPMRLGESQ